MKVSATLSFLAAAFPALIAAENVVGSCDKFAIVGGKPGLNLEAKCQPMPHPDIVSRIQIADCFGNFGGKVKPLAGNGKDYSSINDCDIVPRKEAWTADFTCGKGKKQIVSFQDGASNKDGNLNCNGKSGTIETTQVPTATPTHPMRL